MKTTNSQLKTRLILSILTFLGLSVYVSVVFINDSERNIQLWEALTLFLPSFIAGFFTGNLSFWSDLRKTFTKNIPKGMEFPAKDLKAIKSETLMIVKDMKVEGIYLSKGDYEELTNFNFGIKKEDYEHILGKEIGER